MKIKKIGLFAILLGVLLIPFVTVNAASKVYEVTTEGSIHVVYGTGGDGNYVYITYGGDWKGEKKYYNTEKEFEAAIKQSKIDLIKWAESLGVKESNLTDYENNDIKYVKITDGKEKEVQDEKDADKVYVTATVGVNGQKTVEKDPRVVIDKVEISGSTTNFKAGDTPIFTTKTGSDKYIVAAEYWFVKPDPNASGWGMSLTHTKDEKENAELKNDGFFFEKFEKGNIYGHHVTIRVVDNLKYKFTKDTKIYVDGKLYNYTGSTQDGIYIAKYILDLASETSEEKNKAASVDLIRDVIDGVTFDENHPGVSDELADKITNASRDNKEIKAELTITEIDEEDKKAIDEKIKDKVTSDMNIVTYLDISIPVTIDGKEEGYITKLPNDAKITVDAPEDLPEVKDGYERTYAVIRLHDGKIVVLPVTVNEDGSLTFESDSFSDYILTYTDKEIKKEETSEENKEETKEETTSENKEKTPETLDNIQTSFLIAGISILGLLSIRKLKNN